MADTEKVTVILRPDHRDKLDDLGTRVRRACGYRTGASEVIRASLDVALEVLESEDLSELGDLVGVQSRRQAMPVVEDWLKERLTKRVKPRRGRSK